MTPVVVPVEPLQRRFRVALIILGVCILIGGIVESVLLSVCVDVANDIVRESSSYRHETVPTVMGVWYGVGYCLIGVFSIIAGATYARCAHITNMVFCILGLIGNGLFSIGMLVVFSALENLNSTPCDGDARCTKMLNLAKGATAVVIISWVLTLAACILSGKETCCAPPTTVVIHNQGQGMTSVVTSTNTTMQPYAPHPGQPGYAPPAAGYHPQYPGYNPGAQPPAYPTNKGFEQ